MSDYQTMVLERHPDACAERVEAEDGVEQWLIRLNRESGKPVFCEGATEALAWENAAKKLKEPVESEIKVLPSDTAPFWRFLDFDELDG